MVKIQKEFIAQEAHQPEWEMLQDIEMHGLVQRNTKNHSTEIQAQENLRNETLVGVLDGEILIQNHCYRADEMATMINISKEFDYKITTFHHAVEAYKIADLLADEGVCAAMWADWWGFKHMKLMI